MMKIVPHSFEISQEKFCNFFASKNSRYLSENSKRDKFWDKLRSNSQELELMLKQGNELEILKYAERMQNCSKSLLFALEADSQGDMSHRLKSAFFCRFRHCAVCQARRSRRNYAQFLNSLPILLSGHQGARWLFLTLTVPNVPVFELRDTLLKMNQAWNRFNKRKEFKNILAWVRSTEITKDLNCQGYAHPHFHVLIMTKSHYFVRNNYINQEKWLKAWREAMRDDSIVSVDIRIADRHKGEKLSGQALVKCVSETLKYSVKPSDMVENREWVVELIRQVHKLRFLAAGGLLKSVFVKKKLTQAEMIHTGESESVGKEVSELAYWWTSFERRYVTKKAF